MDSAPFSNVAKPEEAKGERLRINLKTSAKGIIQPDITAEAPSPERVEQLLAVGIKILKRQGTTNGFSWPAGQE